jgi:hypothetical protein
MYYEPLKTKIIMNTSWDEETFQLDDWVAHKKTMTVLLRTECISVARLCHRLWNTSCKNAKYNQSDKRPYCPDSLSPPPSRTFSQKVKPLSNSTRVLLNGIAESELKGKEIREQTLIGWGRLMQGHISIAWQQWYEETRTKKKKGTDISPYGQNGSFFIYGSAATISGREGTSKYMDCCRQLRLER